MTSNAGENFLSVDLDMSETTLVAGADCLLGVHATQLAQQIKHPPEDFDLIWRANGTAVLSIRLWREQIPPFRHAVVVIELAFTDGCVSDIIGVARRSFGA